MVLPFLIMSTAVYPLSLLRLFQNVCKPAEEATHRPPTLQEIKQKIDSYNTREKNCLGMKLVRAGGLPACPHPAPAASSTGAPLFSLWILGRPLPFLQSWGGLGACGRLSGTPPPAPVCCRETEWTLE